MTSTNAGPVRFDVREYARTARGNHRAELQLEGFAAHPLDSGQLHALTYLGRLESATMEQLRNLLVTATHKDARVTAFLVTWAFEKFWIADAIDAILEAHGLPKAQSTDESEVKRSRSEAAEHRGPIRRAILGMTAGFAIIGVHMTMGLVDEWVSRAAYERLEQNAANADLSSTIRLILDIKQRHSAFFEGESIARLTESASTVRQTRRELVRTSWPIGTIDRGADDRTFFSEYVFGGLRGAESASAIGRRVAALPGLDSTIGERIANGLLPK